MITFDSHNTIDHKSDKSMSTAASLHSSQTVAPPAFSTGVKAPSVAQKSMSSAAAAPTRKLNGAPLPEHIVREREIMQRDDGIPVHLKGGEKDKMTYYTTLGLLV